MNDVGVFLVLVCRDPHLYMSYTLNRFGQLTFLKVLRPARILPPIQVEYCVSATLSTKKDRYSSPCARAEHIFSA